MGLTHDKVSVKEIRDTSWWRTRTISAVTRAELLSLAVLVVVAVVVVAAVLVVDARRFLQDVGCGTQDAGTLHAAAWRITQDAACTLKHGTDHASRGTRRARCAACGTQRAALSSTQWRQSQQSSNRYEQDQPKTEKLPSLPVSVNKSTPFARAVAIQSKGRDSCHPRAPHII